MFIKISNSDFWVDEIGVKCCGMKIMFFPYVLGLNNLDLLC